MSLTAIRDDLAALLSTVAGIGDVLTYSPDTIGALPACWIGDAVADVAMGALEVWSYTLPITCVVSRRGLYDQERRATELLVAGIMTAIRSNYTLSGTTFGLNVTSYREGQVQIGGQPYVGFTLSVQVKEKTARTLT